MEETAAHIRDIQQQLLKLIKISKTLHKENAQLREQFLEMQEANQKLSADNDDLQQQQLILKASLESLSPADKKDLEKKLNHYIRNLDKAIAQLST